MEQIKVKVEGGYFVITESKNPDYLSVDIEFFADDEKGDPISRPRVIFAKPFADKLKVLVWENRNDINPTKEIQIASEDGDFMIWESDNPDYPCVDVEFVAENDNGESLSRPRVMFEKPIDDNLRVLVWENPNDLMPTTEIYFKENQEE